MGTPRDDEADAAHDFVDTSATMLHGVSDATANPHTSAGEARASHFAYPERAAEQRVDIHPAQAVGNASSSMLSAIATFTAFSFHGLIEGIALGVVGDVRPLFVAVGKYASPPNYYPLSICVHSCCSFHPRVARSVQVLTRPLLPSRWALPSLEHILAAAALLARQWSLWQCFVSLVLHRLAFSLGVDLPVGMATRITLKNI